MIKHLKLFTIVSILFLWITNCHSMEFQSFHINFSESEFSLSETDDGFTSITGNDFFANGDTDEPNLPIKQTNLLMPESSQFLSYEIISYNTVIIKEGIMVAPNHTPIPTNESASQANTSSITYDYSRYPVDIISFQGTIDIEGYRIMQFAICPFIYDVVSKSLYLITDIDLTIAYDYGNNMNNERTFERSNLQLEEIAQSLISNKESIILPSSLNENFSVWIHQNDYIEYAIITNSELQPAFDNFAKWKTAKGIKTQIYTTETINRIYNTTEDLQLKIKKHINNLYKNHGLKYVLLAGDDSIIPVRYCPGKVGKYSDNNIPSDMYYACLNGDLAWDKNNNRVFAELSDSIDFNSNIFVSRLPVSSSQEVLDYTRKLINYETRPLAKTWNLSILLSGAIFEDYMSNGSSDSYAKACNLYSTYIRPYWGKAPTFLYDKMATIQPIYKPLNVELTSSSLIQELDKGHIFIDVITHGSQTTWSLWKEPFTTNDVGNINNTGYSIITTSACHTSAFDSQISGLTARVCLGEAFINSSNSGILSYLGSSRYGWMNKMADIEYSPKLNGLFYEYCLSTDISSKKFGPAIDYAKKKILNLPDPHKAYRWLMLSVNGLGDPEMPIYTCIPANLPSPLIKYSNNEIIIDTNIEDCNICVMSYNDWGKSLYHAYENNSNVRIKSDKFLGSVTICITKQNYIPRIFKINLGSSTSGKLGQIESSELFPYNDDFFNPIINPFNNRQNPADELSLDYNGPERLITINFEGNNPYPDLKLILTDASGIIHLAEEISNGDRLRRIQIPNELRGMFTILLKRNDNILSSKNIVIY